MKRSQKRLLKITGIVIGITLIIGVFIQSFVFVDTAFYGTVSCNKETGCTTAQLDSCAKSVSTVEANDGWSCESCRVWCSDTSEMRTRSNAYNFPCQYYYGGGALVEAKAKCVLEEPKSHAKTACADGTRSVFSSGSDYPGEKEFPSYDVYWLNEIDQIEDRYDNCGSDEVCTQITSVSAKCVDVESENRYIKLDHQGCYAFSSRWEVWWFDSDNKISQRVEICDDICINAKCMSSAVDPGEDPGTEPVCEYGTCDIDVTFTCKSGDEIVAYTCESGCAIPTTDVCPGDVTPPFSACKTWQRETLLGCELDFSKLMNPDILKSLIMENKLASTAILGIVLIGLTLFMTQKGKGRRL